MPEFINPLVRVTAHYFVDNIENSERISRWYIREIGPDYNSLREFIEFSIYEPELGEIDHLTQFQILLKGIAVVPSESLWWSSFINETFKDQIEGDYLDWLILTNKKLKEYRKRDKNNYGKVGITFIALNDGEKVEFTEEEEEDYE